MNIGIISFPSLGGSGMLATRLAIELAKRDHDVHYISYKRPFGLIADIEHITLHQVPLGSYSLFSEIGNLYTINLANFIAKVVKQESIEVVNSHYAIPHAVSGYLASQLVKFKSVVTLHGSDTHLLGQQEAFRDVVGLALRNSEELTAVSHYLADLSVETFQLPTKPHVIYDFIDIDEFRPGPEHRPNVIVHASNFREIKRVPFLVETFGRVAQDHPDWRLRLIGDGPDRIKCLRLARQLKIRNQIDFVEPHMNIPHDFANAAILACPSRVESFGLTIGEGMSCETPIWASTGGGIPEVCVDGETGELFDPEDNDEAEEDLRRLMDDENRRRRMGKKAREVVSEKFSMKQIVTEYERTFNNH